MEDLDFEVVEFALAVYFLDCLLPLLLHPDSVLDREVPTSLTTIAMSAHLDLNWFFCKIMSQCSQSSKSTLYLWIKVIWQV